MSVFCAIYALQTWCTINIITLPKQFQAMDLSQRNLKVKECLIKALHVRLFIVNVLILRSFVSFTDLELGSSYGHFVFNYYIISNHNRLSADSLFYVIVHHFISTLQIKHANYLIIYNAFSEQYIS